MSDTNYEYCKTRLRNAISKHYEAEIRDMRLDSRHSWHLMSECQALLDDLSHGDYLAYKENQNAQSA